jgi:hypothetical protein
MGKRAINWVNVLLAWSTDDFHYSIKLIQCWCAWEHRFTKQELSQDASHAPHVYTLGVFVRSKQNLGSSVPSCGDIVSQKGLCLCFLNIQWASKPEISHLYVAFWIQ